MQILSLCLLVLLFFTNCTYGFYSAVASPTVSTSLTLYTTASGTTSVVYMLSQSKRGNLSRLLASIYLPIIKDQSGEYIFSISTKGWEGNTIMLSSSLLYYYSISNTYRISLSDIPKKENTLPTFPWGKVDVRQDPLISIAQIEEYIISLCGAHLIIPLRNVDLWEMYPLAVLRKFVQSQKKRSIIRDIAEKKDIPNKILQDKESNNTTTDLSNIPSDNLITQLKNSTNSPCNLNKVEIEPIKLSSCISDFKVKRNFCFGKFTYVCKSRKDRKVTYISVPWVSGIRKSTEELKVIYDFVRNMQTDSLNGKLSNININQNVTAVSLALILYLRERQYDNHLVELINYKTNLFSRVFRKFVNGVLYISDLFCLAHRKNKTKLAPWKRIPEIQWKTTPATTFELLVFTTHLEVLREVKYSSMEWNQFDYIIAAILNFLVISLGVPTLYGQYINKVSRTNLLFERSALNLETFHNAHKRSSD
ncbi:uncharacterized protein CMU_026510 [Cryptosporidium muris RN66]|uniref:Uncharacterized protein n=1 Tax=Cryptosporidium muris (strain RN66) TaxID=441375 RepID=B6AB91_CRYMR|nr:uncharacterized protein CMU_026510 [Cryptosporidium muris RN66]EEA05643.1 hypothetical protein, conserved [Cryptosporidium muris RN66]|eukprot:XP_002139992.1 hypothetical protein [Cryptosporidium muris RN66]